DPLIDPDVDGVAGFLADRLSQRRLHGKPVRPVALGHQRTVERRPVDLTTDLHQPAGAEQLGHVVHRYARPRAWVVALLELGVELFVHVLFDCRTLANSSLRGNYYAGTILRAAGPVLVGPGSSLN